MTGRVTAAFLVALLCPVATSAFVGFEHLPYDCWDLGPEQFGVPAKVEISATLDGGAVRSVTVTSYTPDSDVGYDIAAEAVAAVEACGPYGNLSGEFELVLDVQNPPKRPSEVVTSIPLPGKQ